MLEVVPEELAPGLVAAGRFRLERRIGGGGMGEVWAATQLVTGKSVALKFLKPSRAGDARSHARMAHEARAACAIRHPNVAEIHDVAELDSGLPFLVMDLLHGETLAAKLEREKVLRPEEAARLMLPVVSAVQSLHAAGVVHRDLKPENVFLSQEGEGDGVRVRVLDFGVAKLVNAAHLEGEAPLTATGDVTGTSLYMAPEQLFAETDLDGRADVWALGVMLYEMLAGQRPTQRGSVGQVLKAITTDELIPLSRAAPATPAPLARLVMRMLARDRSERPELGAVAEVLGAVGASSTARSRRWPWVAVASAPLLALAWGVSRGSAPVVAPEHHVRSVASAEEPRSVVPTINVAPTQPEVPMAPSAATPRPSVAISSAAPVRNRPSLASPPLPLDGGPMPKGSSSGIILTHDRK